MNEQIEDNALRKVFKELDIEHIEVVKLYVNATTYLVQFIRSKNLKGELLPSLSEEGRRCILAISIISKMLGTIINEQRGGNTTADK